MLEKVGKFGKKSKFLRKVRKQLFGPKRPDQLAEPIMAA